MLFEGVADEDDVFMASWTLVLVVLLGLTGDVYDVLRGVSKALESPVSSLLRNLFEWIQAML